MPFHVQLTKRRFKKKDGSIAVYWTLRWPGTTGKMHSQSIGAVGEITKSKAETLRREREAAILGGAIRRDRPKEITLKEYLDADTDRIRPDVKLSTLEGHKHAAAHAIAALGAMTRLSSIGSLEVARLKTWLAEEQKVAPATIAKTLRTLKASFYRAVKDGLIQENPFAGVKMPRTQSRPKRIFSPEETAAMREVASSAWWRSFIAVAETTGLRKSELLHLMWRDIDFEKKTLRVAAKRSGEVKVPGHGTLPILAWTAKSYEERVVPLPEATVNTLARLQVESDGSPYVFLTVDRLNRIDRELKRKGVLGPNYELVNNLHRQLDEIQDAARARLAERRGVPVEKVAWERGTLHDLRRTYGTRLSRVVPIHVLKEYMGHAKIQTTQEFYLAAETEDADRARSALDAMLGAARSSRAVEPETTKTAETKKDKALQTQGLGSEADGTRTRNHRIDSPVL